MLIFRRQNTPGGYTEWGVAQRIGASGEQAAFAIGRSYALAMRRDRAASESSGVLPSWRTYAPDFDPRSYVT